MNKGDVVYIVAVLISTGTFVLGSVLGSYSGASTVRGDAIKAGVAQWSVDSKTGVTKFEWIKPVDSK